MLKRHYIFVAVPTPLCAPPTLGFGESLNNILYFLVNDSSTISLLFHLHIGGQTPAPFYLAPNLAVRYGFIRLGGVPSYLIRV